MRTEALFQTGWFMESLATQVLVIFVIRTRGNPLHSWPNPLLLATSLAIAAVGILLPYTAIGRWFGFVPLPPTFLAALGVMVVCYLMLAECAKRWFYRHYSLRVARSSILRPQFPLTGI
jgi:P-type Mg2+ transporter